MPKLRRLLCFIFFQEVIYTEKLRRWWKQLWCNHEYVQSGDVGNYIVNSKVLPVTFHKEHAYVFCCKLICKKCGKEIYEQLRVAGTL